MAPCLKIELKFHHYQTTSPVCLQVILNTVLCNQSALLYSSIYLELWKSSFCIASIFSNNFCHWSLFCSDSSVLLAKYHQLYNDILVNPIFSGSDASPALPSSTNPKIYLKFAAPSSNAYMSRYQLLKIPHSSNACKSRYQLLKILLAVASLLSISLSKI